MPLSPKMYTFGCGCFAALGSFLFGYDLGVIAGVLVAPDFLATTGNPDANYTGFIASSMLLGAFAGTIPAALLADRFSRRFAIFISSLIFIFGGALQTGARNREMMLAGRFFAGYGIGSLGMLAPLYQSEIAAPSRRGALTTLVQLFLGLGALVASFVVYGCNVNLEGTEAEWRVPLALQMVPAIPLATMIFMLPESPRWLAAAGRREEALKSLARLHARGDTSDTFVLAELAEIEQAVTDQKQKEAKWSRFLTDRQAQRKVFLGISLQFSVQMTGVSALQYFSPAIFATMGFTARKTLLLQSFNSIVAICGEVACVLFIDKLGRRRPLIGANIIAGICFVIATILQAQFPNSGPNFSQSAAIAFVFCTWLFNLAFSAGIGPLSWAVP
ncbi:MFS general substrate transporter, partial [Jaminaea rosea]